MASGQATHERMTSRDNVRTGSNRVFGLVFTAVFAVVGLWPLIAGTEPRIWAIVLAAVFLLTALLRPTLFRHLNLFWFQVGLLLNKVTNPLILGLLFYASITPFALVMRMMRKDPLRLALDAKIDSYWIERQPPGPSGASMRWQF